MKTLIALIVTGLVSQVAFAQAQEGKEGKNHPCKNIVTACEAGGYVKGGHKKDAKKGLWKDCVEPIKAGQSVPGVTVSAEDVTACKEIKEKRAERKAEKAAAASSAPTTAPVPAAK